MMGGRWQVTRALIAAGERARETDREREAHRDKMDRALQATNADLDSARDAGAAIGDAHRVDVMRKRATLLYFCACGRNVAFLTWPTRDRALLWSANRRRPGAWMWADTNFWGTTARCPRCRRVYNIELHALAPWVSAGPDAKRDTLQFTARDFAGPV